MSKVRVLENLGVRAWGAIKNMQTRVLTSAKAISWPKDWASFRAALKNSLASPQRFFIICALVFGLPILFLRPAYDVPDFGAHLIRGYSLAGGTVIPHQIDSSNLYNSKIYKKDVTYVGGPVPEAVARYVNMAIPNYTGDYEKIAPRDQLKLYTAHESRKPVLVPNNTAAVYNPISYLTLAAGFIIGNILHLSIYSSVLLVSALHFGIWLFLIRKAIQVSVIGKWFIVVVNLLPMTLFLVPSISTDPLLIGCLFLFFAYLTRYLTANRKLVLKDMLPLIILAIALSTVKQTYFIFVLLTFMLHTKFLRSKDRNMTNALAVGLPILMVGIWSVIIKHMNIIVSTATGSDSQIQFMLTHPLNVAQVYLNTIIFRFDSISWTFFGVLGRLSLPIPLLCVLLLAIALALSIGLNKEKFVIKKWQTRSFGLIFFGSFLLILTSFYLYWSPFGSRFIDGLQGRYFIPIVAFALPLMTRFRIERASHATVIHAIEFIVVFSLMVSTILMSRFYYPDINLLRIL